VATGWRQLIEERPRLTARLAATVPATDRPRILYDPELPGFGLRVSAASPRNRFGARTWVVEYRPGCRGRTVAKKRVSLGRIEVVSADDARRRAREILADVLATGADPASSLARSRAASTIDQIRDDYFSATNPHRKPRTRELYDGLWRLHISPAIGSIKVDGVSKVVVAELHTKLGARHPATANRVIILLAHFFDWCVKMERVRLENNPARGIVKFKMQARERFLSPAEFARLGAAITLAETAGIEWRPDPSKRVKHAPKAESRRLRISPASAAAIRLLIFTGARLREILNLEWSQVDLNRGVLRLRDSKTGPKNVVLGAPAVEILSLLQEKRSKDDKAKMVIEGSDPARAKSDLQRPWKLIRSHANLADFRLHDLRHSFASVGAAANLGLPVIGELLGHSDPATTARYAHLAVEPLRAATENINSKILEMLSG
jgi:integrase